MKRTNKMLVAMAIANALNIEAPQHNQPEKADPDIAQRYPSDDFYYDIATGTWKQKLYYKKKW